MTTRRDLFLAQGGKCFYCSKFMSAFPWQEENKNGHTRDHFYPKSKDAPIPGSENIVLSCRPCNMKKADKPPTPSQIKRHTRLYRLVSMV